LSILLFDRTNVLKRLVSFRLIGGLLIAIAARGEIIDRIAASVGNRVVTTSALDRQIRVTAFQDGVKLDFSPARRRNMLESMIEQNLVQFELASSRYPLPDPAELLPAIDELKKAHFKDETTYHAPLPPYG